MNGRKNCVLITGADRGLGLGFVRHYLGVGRPVIATSRRSQPGEDLTALTEKFPERLQILRLDTGDEASIAEFADGVGNQNSTFGIAINNAGVSIDEAFGQWTAEVFRRQFLVNAVGPALVVQAIKQFLEPGAKVVNLSSGMGSIEWNNQPEAPLDAYAASKCGLNILSRRLAEKLRPCGIVVFALNPGWVKTDMGGQEARTTVDEAIAEMTSTIEKVGIERAGTFVASDGSEIPW